MGEAPARPAGRYGDRTPAEAARRRRRLRAAGAALAAAGVGYAAWVAAASADDVAFAPVGYELLDDTRLQVTFTVTSDPGTTAVCRVEALSSGAAVVGLATVEVPPSEQETTTVVTEVRTSERPVNGQPVSCEPA